MNDTIMRIAKLTERGILSYNSGNYENALTLFEEALDIYPQWLGGLQYRAMCKIRLAKSVSEAKEALADLEEVAPNLILLLNFSVFPPEI